MFHTSGITWWNCPHGGGNFRTHTPPPPATGPVPLLRQIAYVDPPAAYTPPNPPGVVPTNRNYSSQTLRLRNPLRTHRRPFGYSIPRLMVGTSWTINIKPGLMGQLCTGINSNSFQQKKKYARKLQEKFVITQALKKTKLFKIKYMIHISVV